jgi:hypothetical protein
MGTSAFAGHAGDMTPMPHEILGAVAILATIGVALIIIGGIGIWLLYRIERRLRQRQ